MRGHYRRRANSGIARCLRGDTRVNMKARIYDEALFELRRGPVVLAVLRPRRWDWLRVALMFSDGDKWVAAFCLSVPSLRLRDRDFVKVSLFRAGRLGADRRVSAVHLLWLHVAGRSFTAKEARRC